MRAVAFTLYALLVAGVPPASFVYAASPDVPANTQPAGESPPADPVDDDQTAEEMLAAEAALEAAQGEAEDLPAGDAADTAAAPTRPSNNNEDFVPTIQISEDLSVSFPVDI